MLAISPLSVKAQCGFRFSEYILNENTAPVAVDQVSTTFNPEVLYTQSISVYPNPFADKLFITTDKEQSVIITDVTGKCVFSGTVNNTALNTSLWTSGLYIIRSTDGRVQKFLKE